MDKIQVQLRGGYSDRNHINEVNKNIQYKDLDKRSRTCILNHIKILISELHDKNRQSLYHLLLSEVYVLEIKTEGYYRDAKIIKIIRETINEDEYDKVLTLLEFIANTCETLLAKQKHKSSYDDLYGTLNAVFKKEFIGYRFLNKKIVPITDEYEINTIEETSNNTNNNVKTHITKALKYLSDREKPDYENSIKESIIAVESICSQIAEKRNATLGEALKVLEQKGTEIHPALNQAFSKLYGYTSDANGIRHSGNIAGPNSTFEEAKFMLVSCCAFINYLKGNIKD